MEHASQVPRAAHELVGPGLRLKCPELLSFPLAPSAASILQSLLI